MKEITIHISIRTLLSILAFVIGVFLLLQLWNIVLILFAALILAALIDPFASWLEQKKIPRGISVLIIYCGLGIIIGTVISVLIPILSNDIPALIERFQELLVTLQQTEQYRAFVEGAQQLGLSSDSARNTATSDGAGTAISNVFGAVSNIFQSVASLVLILVIAFYMVTEEDPLKSIIHSVVPEKYVDHTVRVLYRIRDKLAAWIRGQLLLSIVIGGITFVGLALLDIRYAVALAVIAALLEFIPYIGPILAALPALLIAFTQGGPVLFLVVLVFYTVVQQLENHFLAPKIMQKVVGLNPVVSIIALLIGAKLAGLLGAIIAIPVATAITVIIKDVLKQKTI